MEAYGKIFVVVAVLALIFAGIAAYLFYLDQKLGKMEKKLKEMEDNEKVKS
ncbi:MAG: CcmD family protein [Bacteroidota bacterium]